MSNDFHETIPCPTLLTVPQQQRVDAAAAQVLTDDLRRDIGPSVEPLGHTIEGFEAFSWDVDPVHLSDALSEAATLPLSLWVGSTELLQAIWLSLDAKPATAVGHSTDDF